MIDALGSPQSVLVLGGTSDIGLAILRRLPRARLARVVLAGRDAAGLAAAAGALVAEGFPQPEVVALEAADTGAHGPLMDAAFAVGDIDLTVLAVGALGDQAEAEADTGAALRIAEAGYTGPLSLMLHVGRHLRSQGHGCLVVLSSMAGRQARRSNFVYGSAKAGLDLAALGLGDALDGSGARVLVVRPGFVRTTMTAHLRPAPLAVDADDVAKATVGALGGRRAVVHVPAVMGAVGAVLGLLPRSVLRRLPF